MTGIDIEPFEPSMLDAVVRLSLRAWEPVLASMKAGMDSAVFSAFYPDGWHASQSSVVTDACSDRAIDTWVARVDSEVAGFVSTKVHEDGVMGEIHMIAVDPDFQRRGIATRLTDHSVEHLRSADVQIVMVETAPAVAGSIWTRRLSASWALCPLGSSGGR